MDVDVDAYVLTLEPSFRSNPSFVMYLHLSRQSKCSFEVLKRASEVLLPEDYQLVEEYRSSYSCCAWPLCAADNSTNLQKETKVFSLEQKCIVDMTEVYYYCSDKCFQHGKTFQKLIGGESRSFRAKLIPDAFLSWVDKEHYGIAIPVPNPSPDIKEIAISERTVLPNTEEEDDVELLESMGLEKRTPEEIEQLRGRLKELGIKAPTVGADMYKYHKDVGISNLSPSAKVMDAILSWRTPITSMILRGEPVPEEEVPTQVEEEEEDIPMPADDEEVEETYEIPPEVLARRALIHKSFFEKVSGWEKKLPPALREMLGDRYNPESLLFPSYSHDFGVLAERAIISLNCNSKIHLSVAEDWNIFSLSLLNALCQAKPALEPFVHTLNSILLVGGKPAKGFKALKLTESGLGVMVSFWLEG